MKFLNNKFLTFTVLALMFSVAVSGGCGGGSSGRYSGNFGNSSQDVTPPVTPESQDVIPENPTSDDEFGNNDDWLIVEDDLQTVEQSLYYFNALNNTEWEIFNIAVGDSTMDPEEKGNCVVSRDNNYMPYGLKLSVISNDTLIWYDSTGKAHTDISDAFNVKAFDTEYNISFDAPILRSVAGFKNVTTTNPNYEHYQASVGSFASSNGRERIEIFKEVPPKYINVVNYFYVNNEEYWAYAELKLFKQSFKFSKFSDLDNTVWTIESMNVQTMQENQTECKIVDNSLNYNDFTKLKLITDESGRMTWFHFDNADSETYHFDDLTVKFVNPLANNSIDIAPMLRTATNFTFHIGEDGEDGDNKWYFEATQGPSFTNKENEIEQVFRTNDNKLLGIMNVFYIGEVPFMSSMILAPTN